MPGLKGIKQMKHPKVMEALKNELRKKAAENRGVTSKRVR